MKIVIIGSGVYGSYVANLLVEKKIKCQIDLLEVGDENIKTEKDQGFYSKCKNLIYKGLSHGRFFGLGGSSNMWGGQLLFFSINDFKNPNKFLKEIIDLNIKFKHTVLKRFGLKNNDKEVFFSQSIFIKTGIWLSFFSRNFFKYFKISTKKNISVKKNHRLNKIFLNQDNSVKAIEVIINSKKEIVEYDYYFLCPGAFETARILLNSNCFNKKEIYFSDHIAREVFKISGTSKIKNMDFSFRRSKLSLLTKRMVGEFKGVSYYIHPVFNTNFPFFQSIKNIFYKREYSFFNFKNLFTGVVDGIKFVYIFILKQKIYIKDGEWSLFVDIENPTRESKVYLSDKVDEYGQKGLVVDYEIGGLSSKVYEEAIKKVTSFLDDDNINYELLIEDIKIEKYEDIYHPYKMFDDFKDVNDYFNKYSNMLIVNTGILPRSGGINPTAVLLPLIEEFINIKFSLNEYFNK
jgi:hypothetical protein